jgi:hypothetical protein
MIRTFLVSLYFMLILVPSMAHSESEAPFGLTWGISVEDVRKMGVELKEIRESTEFGATFLALKMPKVLGDQKSTFLFFGFNNRLWRIAAISKEFSNDPYGNAVKSRYNELVSILTEKYGNPSNFHHLGRYIYSQPEHFLAGIKGGESSWFSHFNTAELELQLAINAVDYSTANWVLSFINKALKKSFEFDKKVKEKGAL